MRAKLRVSRVENHGQSETLHFDAVCASEFGKDGSDENNTYARYTPSASLRMYVNNPALVGVHKEGEEFYLDFIRAVKKDAEFSRD